MDKIIDSVNRQKLKANKLELKFIIGLIIMNSIDSIYTIETIKKRYNLNYIVVIRDREGDSLLEYLVNNNRLINNHIIIEPDTDIEHCINELIYDEIFYI